MSVVEVVKKHGFAQAATSTYLSSDLQKLRRVKELPVVKNASQNGTHLLSFSRICRFIGGIILIVLGFCLLSGHSMGELVCGSLIFSAYLALEKFVLRWEKSKGRAHRSRS